MTNEKSYYLGTTEGEITRLGLQHRVWQPIVLSLWQKAGITLGMKGIDAGAGPGYATLDLADIVGPAGHVTALERSGNFVRHLQAQVEQRNFRNIAVVETDLAENNIREFDMDFVWVRWVFAFLEDPLAVLRKLSTTLRPGGRMVIFEYLDWGAMTWIPKTPNLDQFKEKILEDWRNTGAEIDCAPDIISALPEAGLRLISSETDMRMCTPKDFFWQWPQTFLIPHARTMVERGTVTEREAEAFIAAYEELTVNPHAMMAIPLLAGIVAERM